MTINYNIGIRNGKSFMLHKLQRELEYLTTVTKQHKIDFLEISKLVEAISVQTPLSFSDACSHVAYNISLGRDIAFIQKMYNITLE